MTSRTWLITGVSSGFGRELATQLLDRGEVVVGTVRRPDSVAGLVQKYPGTFHRELLDVTDADAIRDLVDRSFVSLGRVDVVVSNAGYGLFGAAEELSDQQVSHIIATNLTGSIQLIRASLPHLRAQGGGRIIQISSYVARSHPRHPPPGAAGGEPRCPACRADGSRPRLDRRFSRGDHRARRPVSRGHAADDRPLTSPPAATRAKL